MMQQKIKCLLSNHFKSSLTISYRVCVKLLCIRNESKRDLLRYHYNQLCSIIISACRIWLSIKCLCFFKKLPQKEDISGKLVDSELSRPTLGNQNQTLLVFTLNLLFELKRKDKKKKIKRKDKRKDKKIKRKR